MNYRANDGDPIRRRPCIRAASKTLVMIRVMTTGHRIGDTNVPM